MPLYPNMGDFLNGTTSITDILVYANVLTGGILGPLILGAFFLITLLGGLFMQIRFAGRENFASSFAVAGFTTFGFAVLMSLQNGLLNPDYVFIALGVAIIGTVWLYFSSQP